jgi:hypothetical protein
MDKHLRLFTRKSDREDNSRRDAETLRTALINHKKAQGTQKSRILVSFVLLVAKKWVTASLRQSFRAPCD